MLLKPASYNRKQVRTSSQLCICTVAKDGGKRGKGKGYSASLLSQIQKMYMFLSLVFEPLPRGDFLLGKQGSTIL